MNGNHTSAHQTLLACPVCDSAALTVLEPASDIQAFITSGVEFTFHMGLSGCQTCGFIFLNPRATQDEMSRYYSLQARKPKSFENLDRPYAELLDFQASFIRKRWDPKQPQRILDIGAAEGFFLKRLAAECDLPPRLEGIEPGSVYAAAARALLPDAVIYEDVLESTDLPATVYDLVTICHVLEHLLEPVAALRIVRPLLKPDGILHVEVPDVSDIPPTISPFIHHEHMNSFTPATLRLALERAGFEILVHESAQDNPVGSGFSYPIQRVLASPAAEPGAARQAAAPKFTDSETIYRNYGERQRAFLGGQSEVARQRLMELAAKGGRLAIFGAGPHTFDLFRTLQLSPSIFTIALDNNPHKTGKRIRGLEIVQPTAEVIRSLDAVLISSAEFEDAMVAQIAGFDVPDVEVLRVYGAR